jgi:hypothetical protein
MLKDLFSSIRSRRRVAVVVVLKSKDKAIPLQAWKALRVPGG